MLLPSREGGAAADSPDRRSLRPVDDGLRGIGPSVRSSSVGTAVRPAARQPIAGVVLASDGGSSAGGPPPSAGSSHPSGLARSGPLEEHPGAGPATLPGEPKAADGSGFADAGGSASPSRRRHRRQPSDQSAAEARLRQAKRERKRAQPKGPWVLVVDDEAAVRGMIASSLRRSGLRPVEAASLDEALRAVSNPSAVPEAAVIDWDLGGGVKGDMVLARLREAGWARPAVLCSGQALSPEEQAGFGFADMVVKGTPAIGSVLGTALERLL